MGLIYRDLKPANILLQSDGHIQLVDLGAVIDLSGNVLDHNDNNDKIGALFNNDSQRFSFENNTRNSSNHNSMNILYQHSKYLGPLKSVAVSTEPTGHLKRAKSIMGTSG